MNQSATGDAESFLALLKPIERDLENYCRRLIWDPGDAPDALQNAVLRAFRAFDRYHADASFRAWMFKILTREAFALNRKHVRIARHEFQMEPEELAELPFAGEPGQGDAPFLSAEALNEALEPVVAAGLKTLTETERAVLLLRSIGELRYREIAESLSIPLGSVMGNLFRARQKMRMLIKRSPQGANLLKENRV
jgi:RNA polymerase sigma-70 factor (ECF subfamily)